MVTFGDIVSIVLFNPSNRRAFTDHEYFDKFVIEYLSWLIPEFPDKLPDFRSHFRSFAQFKSLPPFCSFSFSLYT